MRFLYCGYYPQMSCDVIESLQNVPEQFNISYKLLNTIDEHISKINYLKNKVAPGFDKISVKLLKSEQKSISFSLSYIFNLFLELSCIPNEFKHAGIVSIYKNAEKKLDPNNYHPISSSDSNIAKHF